MVQRKAPSIAFPLLSQLHGLLGDAFAISIFKIFCLIFLPNHRRVRNTNVMLNLSISLVFLMLPMESSLYNLAKGSGIHVGEVRLNFGV